MHGVVTRLVTGADCESVEAGAIPVRHPERGRVLVADRRGSGFLNRERQVRLLPGTLEIHA